MTNDIFKNKSDFSTLDQVFVSLHFIDRIPEEILDGKGHSVVEQIAKSGGFSFTRDSQAGARQEPAGDTLRAYTATGRGRTR